MTILHFEEAVNESIQADSELSAYYSSYQDARRRLNDRVKSRGFWPVRKGSFEKGRKGKGKGFKAKAASNLARRIANSTCRLCGKRGHWKDECPQKQTSNASGSTSSIAPTSYVVTEEVPECFSTVPFSDDTWSPIQETFCVVSQEEKTPKGSNPGNQSKENNHQSGSRFQVSVSRNTQETPDF